MKTHSIQTRLDSITIAKLATLIGKHYNRHIRTISQLLAESVKILLASAEQSNITFDIETESQAEQVLLKYNLLLDRINSQPSIEQVIKENSLTIADKRLIDETGLKRIVHAMNNPNEYQMNLDLSNMDIIKE